MKALSSASKIQAVHLLEDRAVLLRANMAIGIGCGDHCPHEGELERLSIRREPLKLRGSALTCGLGRRLLLSLLVILPSLPRLQRQCAESGRTAIADGATGHLPHLLVAEKHAKETAGGEAAECAAAEPAGDSAPSLGQELVFCLLHEIPGGTGTPSQELFNQLLRIHRLILCQTTGRWVPKSGAAKLVSLRM